MYSFFLVVYRRDCVPGEFGVVYRGVLKSGFSDTIGDTVAVKTLRGMQPRIWSS